MSSPHANVTKWPMWPGTKPSVAATNGQMDDAVSLDWQERQGRLKKRRLDTVAIRNFHYIRIARILEDSNIIHDIPEFIPYHRINQSKVRTTNSNAVLPKFECDEEADDDEKKRKGDMKLIHERLALLDHEQKGIPDTKILAIEENEQRMETKSGRDCEGVSREAQKMKLLERGQVETGGVLFNEMELVIKTTTAFLGYIDSAKPSAAMNYVVEKFHVGWVRTLVDRLSNEHEWLKLPGDEVTKEQADEIIEDLQSLNSVLLHALKCIHDEPRFSEVKAQHVCKLDKDDLHRLGL